MITDDLLNYAADLLIVQYRSQPTARLTVKAYCEPVAADLLPLEVQKAFDLETAVGKQLDTLGKYAGVVRTGYDFSGPVSLGDADFRTLIQIALLQNRTDSSFASIQDLLNLFFPGIIKAFDYENMRIGYFIDSDSVSRQLAEFFIKQGSLPKPMGVAMSSLLRRDSIDGVFGFSSADLPAFNTSGFSSSAGWVGNGWLSYGDFV